MIRLMLTLLPLFFVACSIDRTIVDLTESEDHTLAGFQQLPAESKLKIADDQEPGERLMLCLTFIDKESKQHLSGQLVQFYHTSSNGTYEPSDANDESTARLSGQALTNEEGQIYVETILPGDYGSSDDNRHIHTTVFGARPEAYDIHFKQYTGYMGNNFIEGSDQHFLANLKKTKENSLVSFLTIEVKRPLLKGG